MIRLAALGPHAHLLTLGKLRIFFSYEDPVAFLTHDMSVWTRVPEFAPDGTALLTKATRAHLDQHVPLGFITESHDDFLRRLEVALRMTRLD
jgi:hypothetical protein